DTVYMLGSISKTLTAVSVLQFLDRGKIEDLNDPLGKYLPGFDMQERYPDQMRGMTVKRVLNHHSGIPGDIVNAGFVSRSWLDWDRDLYKDWLIDYLRGDYPSHRPGDVASYSNTAFTLAGEMVRNLSGAESFGSYTRENIFVPLGMENSAFRQIKDNSAKGYFQGEPICPDAEMNIAPTGGAYTTAPDMAEFIKMILNGGRSASGKRLLNSGSVDLMGEMEKTPLDVNSYFQPGLGLDTVDDPVMRYAGRAWAKDGGVKNFQTFMEILPDKNLGVIVLANSDTASGFKYAVARECLKNAVREKCGLEPSAPKLPQYETLRGKEKIDGLYVHIGGCDQVAAEDSGDRAVWLRNIQEDEPEKVDLVYNPQKDMYDVQGEKYSLAFVKREWQGRDYMFMIKTGATEGHAAYVAGSRSVGCLGLKTQKADISRAWMKRTGRKYIIDNIGWNDIYLWNYTYFKLRRENGFLMLTGMLDAPVFPEDKDVAFLRGLMSQREDSSIRVIREDGREKLVGGGGFKAYDAALIPSIRRGDTVHGESRFMHNNWYRLELDEDRKPIELSTGNEEFMLRVMDGDLVEQVAHDRGKVILDGDAGTWYVAVCPGPDAPAEFDLEIR
ncbi:MAG: serine hydrolase domain-containing protein, partial [Thermodesulfobacteriota bacterium]